MNCFAICANVGVARRQKFPLVFAHLNTQKLVFCSRSKAIYNREDTDCLESLSRTHRFKRFEEFILKKSTAGILKYSY